MGIIGPSGSAVCIIQINITFSLLSTIVHYYTDCVISLQGPRGEKGNRGETVSLPDLLPNHCYSVFYA